LGHDPRGKHFALFPGKTGLLLPDQALEPCPEAFSSREPATSKTPYKAAHARQVNTTRRQNPM
jgi:hypothetical protein